MNKELLLDIISEHSLVLSNPALSRLIELAAIQPNWDGQGAESMNEDSLRSLCLFLKTVNDAIPHDIGFFFNHEGALSINWMLESRVVDIAFEPEATYLYMQGYDDGIAIPNKVLPNFKYNHPETCLIDYKEKLEIASKVLYKLNQRTAQKLIELITYDKGWGEHEDDESMNIEALYSFIYFIDGLDVDPGKYIIFMTHEGFIEMILMDYKPSHEIEFTPNGVTFFMAPDYESIEVSRQEYYKYKDINQFIQEK